MTCHGVTEEVTLEGGHAVFVEEGRVLPAPQIPEVILGKLLLLAGRVGVESGAHGHAYLMQQLAAAVALAVEIDFLESAVGIEGHAGVEEEVTVVDGVHAAVGEEAFDVLLQLVADAEGVVELAHQLGLLGGEVVGVCGVEGGEEGVGHLIRYAVLHEEAAFLVYILQHEAVLHLPFGAAQDHLGFELELYDGDGLVHLRDEAACLLVVRGVVLVEARAEEVAGVAGVGLHGEGGQGHEVDAVAVLEGLHVAVAQRETQDVGDAAVVAGSGTHPQGVVVAPLDVEAMVLAEAVHDDVGAGAAVEDVAEDVELIDGELLDDGGEGGDEGVGAAGLHDGLNDAGEVGLLVVVGGRFVQELFDDVGELGGQGLADFGACVFG